MKNEVLHGTVASHSAEVEDVFDFLTATRDQSVFRVVRDDPKYRGFDLANERGANAMACLIWEKRVQLDQTAADQGKPLDDVVKHHLGFAATQNADAKAALEWLCGEDPKPYRLATDAERVARNHIRKWTTPVRVEYATTDTGNAERFVAQHGARVRFCHPLGVWLIFNGERWIEDQSGEVDRLAKETARSIYIEAAGALDDGKRDEIVKHARKTEGRRARTDFLHLARSENGIAILPEKLDAKPHLLNLRNGTFDFNAEEFREHRCDDLLTRLCPVTFDANATAPTWEKALTQWLPDVATRDFVQDAAGAALSGIAYDEFWMFLYGDGANGKSTFIKVLGWLFGDYAHTAQAETFMDGRDRDRGKPAPELLSFRGKRLVTVQETAKRHRLNEALIKDLTGRDNITARGTYEKHEATFTPQFTLWMFGNHKPAVGDTSAGTWRRIRLIPFDRIIPDAERDPQLADKLHAELSGISNWALEGLARVMSRGFVVPDAVKAATEQYREEQDTFAAFMAERCDTGPRCSASAKDLFNAWCEWCRDNHEKEGTQRAFGTELGRRKLTKKHTNKGTIWDGIALIERESEPCES